ncbi:MAG: outer membrane lipoprotein-sorting protein [bacterium]
MKMNKIIKLLLISMLLGIVLPANTFPSEMTPKDIITKADDARGSLSGVEWEIKIESIENNRMQDRTINIKSRKFNTLAEFISPPKVKGRKLLMIDRNMWFLSPGLKKPVPISPRQKLMGGASNGDIASTNYAGDYKVTSASEEEVNGEPCYVYDLVANDKKATYDQIRYWISKKRFVGIKSDFFSVSGKLLKSAVMEYENTIEKQGKPYPFISKMIISNNVVEGEITTMTYGNVKLKEIPDSTFDLNLLMR